jgi:murein DD-endopeptidase MepM/ murein hydrolase activator NlpD
VHIILVSNRLATAKTFSVSLRVALAAAIALLCVVLATSFLLLRSPAKTGTPEVVAVGAPQAGNDVKPEVDVRENISSMAVKLGEMQAELMRLDSLGDRISKLTGLAVPKKEKPAIEGKDGQGGPLIQPSRPLAADELQREIDRLAEAVDESADNLTALESQLMERRIKSSLLPTLVPINAKRIGSVFGRRIDPIAGVKASHEGIDFVADTGTPIAAAAGGVVGTASFHPEYGYLVEIDHGNEFSSRYAHLSKIKVRQGQVVKRGQLVGLSGNTGRSTGPHLHFEVRFKGVAQNPDRFLNQNANLAQATVAEAPSRAGKRASISSRNTAKRH